MKAEDLIAYTIVHELDKYNDFDEERIGNFTRSLDLKTVSVIDFTKELQVMTKELSSLKSFPIRDITKIWRLDNPEFYYLNEDDLPISWYYGCGEDWQFCAFWHDN